MPDYKLIGADELTVYDSSRKPIKVKKGGVITTSDAALVRNLSSDTRFAVVDPNPVETKLSNPSERAPRSAHDAAEKDEGGEDERAKAPIENFTTTPPRGTLKLGDKK